MIKLFLYLISIIMMIMGLTFIILYINLFSFGYTIFEYLEFIFTNYECFIFFIGLLILILLIWRG